MIILFFGNTSERARFISLGVGIFAIAILTAICSSRGLDLVNAWNGWAPPSYVWACNDTVTFLKLDFMQEQNLHMGNSLAMRIYPLAYAWLEADPEITQYIFIFITTLLYAASLWLVTSTLIPRVSHVTLWLVIGLALLTETANGNLARFGQANLSLGQAYGVAIPLQLITLALVMRERLLLAGVLLGLLACVHLTLGAITTGIVFVMLCWKTMIWRDWRFWAAGGIVVVCTLAWTFGVVYSVVGNYVSMETAEWVSWERFSNFHWFPFDFGVFTSEHHLRLTPFLALAILAWCCPATEMAAPSVRRSWITGLIASTSLTIIGLIISLWPVSQWLVMLGLHRASGVTLLLLLPMAVLCLTRFLERGNALTAAIATMALACPFFGTYGIPLFPAVTMAGLTLYGRKGNGLSRRQHWMGISLVIAATGYILFLILAGHAHLYDIAFVGQREAWLTAFTVFFVKIVLVIIGRWRPSSEGVAPQSAIMMLIVFFLWQGGDRNWRSNPNVLQSEAPAYLDAQKWARDHTPQRALFMPDPAHTYGWKDYSRRASYGNIRDWTHSVICYHSDSLKFKEGLRRARKLGIDPESYLSRAVKTASIYPGSAEYQRMYQDIRSAYYFMEGVDLLNLAKEEGIDYFVFQLEYVNLLQLKPVYQNAHFAICEPILRRYRVLTEKAFPITLPSNPVHCNDIGKSNYDWVNRGFRGTIWLKRTNSNFATLQLIAGIPNNKSEHILLLSPKAESEKGFPVVSDTKVVTFSSDMRFASKTNYGGNVQFRLDVLSSREGWSYHSKKINVSEYWSHFEASVTLASNAVSVYPTVIWEPSSEGSVLEIRAPLLRWNQVVDSVRTMKPSDVGQSDGQRD